MLLVGLDCYSFHTAITLRSIASFLERLLDIGRLDLILFDYENKIRQSKANFRKNKNKK